MSYVQRVLQPGETVRHVASIHWFVFRWGIFFAALACVSLIYGEFFAERMLFWQVIAGLFALIALGLFLQEWWEWWTTEIAVTTERVIHKHGLIRRNSKEMNIDKIESVEVDQSIFGRMLNFGKVQVKGAGEIIDLPKMIADPLQLRNSITVRSHPSS